VSDEIVCPRVVRNDMEPVLTLTSDFSNIKHIMAMENDLVDPVLQKEMEMLKDSLQNGVTIEVPFTPYLTKS